MKFVVPDLKSLSRAVRRLDARELTALSAMLHRRQPDFCEIVDEVGMDPRCVQAHRFCTMFCALALRHAEEAGVSRLPKYTGDAIREVAGFMATGEEEQIGRRASGYRERILRHVIIHDDFDEDDTAWLSTTISAFLFLVEKSAERKKRR